MNPYELVGNIRDIVKSVPDSNYEAFLSELYKGLELETAEEKQQVREAMNGLRK